MPFPCKWPSFHAGLVWSSGSPRPGEFAQSVVLCVSQGPCPGAVCESLGGAQSPGSGGSGPGEQSCLVPLLFLKGVLSRGRWVYWLLSLGQSWGSVVGPCVDRALRRREAMGPAWSAGPASLLASADAIRVPVSLTAQTSQLSAMPGCISLGLDVSCGQAILGTAMPRWAELCVLAVRSWPEHCVGLYRFH